MDALGPFSIEKIRTFASRWPATTHLGCIVASCSAGDQSNLPLAFRDAIAGHPVILLVRTREDFGHFVLLHRRPQGDLELFDPLGTDADDESWEMYLDDPKGLNGGGFRPYLQDLDRAGVPLSYNRPRNAPQGETANSCGLWCLLRAALPGLSPAAFSKIVRD